VDQGKKFDAEGFIEDIAFVDLGIMKEGGHGMRDNDGLFGGGAIQLGREKGEALGVQLVEIGGAKFARAEVDHVVIIQAVFNLVAMGRTYVGPERCKNEPDVRFFDDGIVEQR
jgi:hypothetical protein